jgi:hypothetical protein
MSENEPDVLRDIAQMYTGFVPLSKIAIALSVNYSLLRQFAINRGFVTVALRRRECLSPIDARKLVTMAKTSGLANPIVKEPKNRPKKGRILPTRRRMCSE